MSFTVLTIDGRASTFEEEPSAFITVWQAAVRDPEKPWPHAYLDGDDGDSAVHFNPLTIVAVSVKIADP